MFLSGDVMEIRVCDGIKIVINDEKLLCWEQTQDKSMFMALVKDKNKIRKFEFDKLEKSFKEVNYGRSK